VKSVGLPWMRGATPTGAADSQPPGRTVSKLPDVRGECLKDVGDTPSTNWG